MLCSSTFIKVDGHVVFSLVYKTILIALLQLKNRTSSLNELCYEFAMSYIWVTRKDNNSPRYDGKTHKVPEECLLNPPLDLSIGTPVTVY